MSNCHVKELERLYRALFEDARYRYPSLEMEFEKDLSRLLMLVEQRGIHVYLVDLPAVGKHLDRCLADGQYKLSGLPLTKRYSNRVVIPKFLRGLYLLVFDEHGCLKEECDVDAVFFLRQILYAAKKYKINCASNKVYDTVVDFIETDASLPELDQFWQESPSTTSSNGLFYTGFLRSDLLLKRVDDLDPEVRDEVLLFLRNLDTVSSVLTTTLGSYDPTEWRFKHGPGAISEVIGPTNKYSWKTWSDGLESEFPIADYGFHNFSSWAGKCNYVDYEGQPSPHSRLVAVPKTFSGPRLIAAEPGAFQWCQQNIWHYFRSRSAATWIGAFISFRDQGLNQGLCTSGSRNDTLATVDLSAASDRITCHVVGQFFRSNPKLLNALRASRTRRVRQSLAGNLPEFVELRKFSTMGSACTFPVESLIFLGTVLAAVLTARRQAPTLWNIQRLVGEVAVFGDDLIVPKDGRELLERAFEVLYFKINTDKSFWTGRFRESCGVDSFDGACVTPVYWRSAFRGKKPETLASAVECCNNFYRKFLLATAESLASTLPRDIPEVAEGSGVFGLKTRCRVRRNGFLTRYNHHLQRAEIRVRSLIVKQARSQTDDDSAILQYFTEAPSPYDIWRHGILLRPKLKHKLRWVPLSDVVSSSNA